MQKEGQNLMTDLFEKIFKEIPQLDSIRWTQYTPYFNDGDACVFSMKEFYYLFNKNANEIPTMADIVEDDDCDDEDDVDDIYDMINAFTLYGLEHYKKPIDKEKSDFLKSLKLTVAQYSLIDEFEDTSRFIEDLFQSVFGDHVSVEVKREKNTKINFIVNEYDHD